jgi:hypothetical protein
MRYMPKYPGAGAGTPHAWLARLVSVFLIFCGHAAAANLELDGSIPTHPDGRMPLERLIQSYQSLIDRGWVLDVVFESRPAGREHALPIIALRTPQAGEAVWILSGIHGEEPAGPNAIAASMDAIAELGARRPLVLLPLNNPHGYVHNWRYLNTATYSESVEGHSVGDSSHLLAEPDNPAIARAPVPSSPEAAAITGYILERAADYPPVISIDLHEDNLISEGYVYSQGELGAVDPLALAAVRVLVENNIKLKMSGETRFGETIEGGITAAARPRGPHGAGVRNTCRRRWASAADRCARRLAANALPGTGRRG